MTNLIVRNIVVNGTKIFAGTRKGVFISTDYGNSWTPINNGLPVNWINGEAFIDIFSLISIGMDIFVGTWGGVYVLSDDSTNWVARRNGLTGSAVFALTIKDSYLFAGTYWSIHPAQGGQVFSSTNNGIDWNIASNGLPDAYINDLGATEENLFVLNNGLDRIYRSSDYGENWFPTSYFSTSTGPLCMLTFQRENVNYFFVGNWYDGEVYLSTNEGEDWTSISEGLPNSTVWSLAIDNEYIFAGLDNKIWKKPFEEITGITRMISPEFQKHFEISQNYPNPFNPITTIKFTIPNSEIVQIKVYDIIGKELKILLDEYKHAGTYEVEFESSNLPSGVYFYRLISGSFSETNKMILLR